ncbi:histidinol-phosphate transaminase [Pukyongia salina]|uniref:Histidinol-phosphate aminotransferase n=1 Tax=Pukyongia salina TaxID=2094025 RepID=A0A2S0HZI2_9FLAO|nr:histidinol-phosphate transaminase [Pukyongia salina]AVI52026.1 histidinol-phosphate transaminase [Pukyongia salina]
MSRTKLIKRLVRANVRKLKAYSSARDEYPGDSEGMIFMDANENPFNTGLNRYPDPFQRKVKKELSAIKHISAEQIFLGNGSDEVLDLLFRAFCEPGIDNCITLPPTYGMYAVLAGLNDIENREVILDATFQPDTERILKVQDERSKLLFFCSPNNPTGNTMNSPEIERMLNDFNGLVVIDEAYIDFSEKESWIKRINDHPNLVVVQTFSKAYGLAGIRLGVCYASSEIIKILNTIKPPYNVNELTQGKAFQAITEYKNIKDTIDRLNDEKSRLYKALLEVDLIKKIYHSDANFLLIEVDDATRRYKELISKGFVVRNRSNQPLCKNTLRITVGTTEENTALIETLKTL